MSLGARLKMCRKQMGLSQERLGDLVGAHVNTVRRWENGSRSPDTDMLQKLAQALDTSTGYLLGETDDPSSPQTLSEAPDPRQELPKSNIREVNFAWIPVISSDVKVCCGTGNIYPEEVAWEVVGHYPISYADLNGYGWQVGDRGIRLFTAEGDSMEPRVSDGDRVLFVDVQPISGDVAVILYRERLMLRGITFEKDRVRLTALNPEYSEIVVPIEQDMDELCVLGKVIGSVKFFPMKGRMW